MKVRFAFAAALIAALFLRSEAYASTNITLTEAYMNEETLDLFTNDSFEEDGLTIKVANREADIINYGTIYTENISVRTTILLDISTSMPAAARDKVTEYINLKIKDLSGNEQLRIVTFGAQLNVLQDFTSDRYDLDKAVGSIKFIGYESEVYDAVYNTIPDIVPLNGQPCFYRTIVITDGVDSAVEGVTKEELFMKLQSQTYPLDVVCVSGAKPAAQNKDLSALARISSGRYFDCFPDVDLNDLSYDSSVSDYFWIRAEVPAALLDGSTRQVDISDGTNSISFDMKMSVVDAPIETPPASQPSSVSQPVSTSSSSLPVSSVPDDEGFPVTLILIIGGAAAAAAVAAVIVVVIVNKKKKKAQQVQAAQTSDPIGNSRVKVESTEIVMEHEGREHYSIKISNTANQTDNWILDVFSDIIIGRAETCAIIIDDKSVSREQCKIAASKNGLAISNLSTSNKTKLNGTVLATEILLHPADNIHFGRVTLRVDYIQKVTDEATPQTPPASTSGVGKTESIF